MHIATSLHRAYVHGYWYGTRTGGRRVVRA